MKKLTYFLLSSFLMLGTVACSQDARTSSDDPGSTDNNAVEQTDENNRIRQAQIESDRRAREQRAINNNEPSNGIGEAQSQSDQRAREQRSINDNAQPNNANDERGTENDATGDVRDRQIESDERARDQRDSVTGNPEERTDDDLESLVSNSLETRLPSNNLDVDSENGVVTISGTVSSQEELNQLESLAKQVPGVKGVNIQATIEPATP